MRQLITILVLTISFAAHAQTNRVEKQLMNCWYGSIGDKEDMVKAFIADYQNLLIRENLLKDSTAKSYRALLKKIAKEGVKNKPSKSFYYGLNELNPSKLEEYEECRNKAIKDSTNSVFKFNRFETVFDSIIRLDHHTRADVAKAIVSVLDEDDFNLEYYRLRTFLIYDLIILSEIWDLKFLEDASTIAKVDLDGALSVYMDSKGDIFMNGIRINVRQFQKMVREYEENKKSKSVILVRTDNDVLYGDYVRLQEMIIGEIHFLREEYALQKYNTEFGNLEEEQKKEVSAIFPVKIVEHSNN